MFPILSALIAEIPGHRRKPRRPHEGHHPLVLAGRGRNARANRRGECVRARAHAPEHSGGWRSALTRPGSLGVRSIIVRFDHANAFAGGQETRRSAFRARQLRSDQNPPRAKGRLRHPPGVVAACLLTRGVRAAAGKRGGAAPAALRFSHQPPRGARLRRNGLRLVRRQRRLRDLKPRYRSGQFPMQRVKA